MTKPRTHRCSVCNKTYAELFAKENHERLCRERNNALKKRKNNG